MTKPMDITDALQIVLELAEQNMLDDPSMRTEQNKQRKAIRLVKRLKDSALLDFFLE